MFKLKADPIFKAKVDIPVAGGDPQSINLHFKHRTKKELNDWISSERMKTLNDLDFLMDVVMGWDDADEPFSREALETLIENHMAAPDVIRDKYLSELAKGRVGN